LNDERSSHPKPAPPKQRRMDNESWVTGCVPKKEQKKEPNGLEVNK